MRYIRVRITENLSPLLHKNISLCDVIADKCEYVNAVSFVRTPVWSQQMCGSSHCLLIVIAYGCAEAVWQDFLLMEELHTLTWCWLLADTPLIPQERMETVRWPTDRVPQCLKTHQYSWCVVVATLYVLCYSECSRKHGCCLVVTLEQNAIYS